MNQVRPTPRMVELLHELVDEWAASTQWAGESAPANDAAAAPPRPPPPRAKAIRRAPMRAPVIPDQTIEVSELNRQRALRGLRRAGYVEVK